MSICPRPRRILPGHSLSQARRHAFPLPLTPCRLSSGIPRYTFHASPNDAQRSSKRPSRIPCPVSRGLRKDPSEWIKHLEKYIPRRNLDKSSATAGETEQKIDHEECEAILELLYQARAQQNFDLLTILGFDFGRWQDFHAIINKLLDFANDRRSVTKRGRLPSNIDWGSLGSLNGLSSGEPIRLADIRYRNDGMPLSSFDSYSEEPVMHNQMGESETKIGIMNEIWQSLGVFILEAADSPTKEISSVMSHFYRVVARLHHADMIPPEVYKYTPKQDPTIPNRPPGMYLLSYPMMSVLSDAAWEATVADDAENEADPDTTPYLPPLRYRSKQLGLGIWLEFVLWCCVEGGYSTGAAWILQKSRDRSETWSVQSWARVYQTTGPTDPLKMDRYDTWAQCGELSSEPFAAPSNRPFLGMGTRTITREVVVAIMDGLMNSLRVGVGVRGDSPSFIWERLGLLRAILSKNKLYLCQADINYFIVRILETGAIVPETKPQSLELLLNLAPYIPPAEEPTEPSKPHVKSLYQQEYDPEYSGVVLGLYQYALNIYASSGNVSGTIDVFEKLLGAVDPEKVFEIRNSVLDPKYLIKAHPVRQTGHNRSRSIKSTSESQSLRLPPVSWTLLLDTFTSSRLYRLANWLTNTCGEALNSSTSRWREGVLITDSLIRLATATKNRQLFSDVAEGLVLPLEHQTLISLLNWSIGESDWERSVELLRYLQDGKNSQWDVINMTSLGAAIVRLESQIARGDQSELDPTLAERQAETLNLANGLLATILNGRFSQHYRYSTGLHTSEAMLNQLHQFFSFIPGSLSNVCREVKLQWDRTYKPNYHIPSHAFNQFLAAVVDTQGSLAGKRLWDEFCIEPLTTKQKRIKTMQNLPVHTTRKPGQRTNMFGAFLNAKPINKKTIPLISPDLTTVRIIAQAALDEQQSLWQNGSHPSYLTANPLTSEEYTAENIDHILDWCAEMFERLHLGRREISRELDGHPKRKSPSTLTESN